MRIISRKRLRDFWTIHPEAEESLQAWFRIVSQATREKFSDVRTTYATADQVNQFTVFNIGGNKFRLIAVINFAGGVVYVRAVLTHAEYDTEKWKMDEFGKQGGWGQGKKADKKDDTGKANPSKRQRKSNSGG